MVKLNFSRWGDYPGGPKGPFEREEVVSEDVMAEP